MTLSDVSSTAIEPDSPAAIVRHPDGDSRRWYLKLSIVCTAGLIFTIAWILISHRHAVAAGDAYYYHNQAALIFGGQGWFINPSLYLQDHLLISQSAQHPPLWTLALVFADAIGLKSYLSQLLFACFVGTGAVFMTGMAGREAAGPRVGLIAALIAALYPNYWMNEATGLSETLVLLLVASVIFESMRLWRRPSLFRAGVLGVLCALAAMARAEQVLLIAVVLVPLALLLRGVTLRRRLVISGVGVVASLLTLGPWVGFNLSRFSHPEFISTGLGGTLIAAN